MRGIPVWRTIHHAVPNFVDHSHPHWRDCTLEFHLAVGGYLECTHGLTQPDRIDPAVTRSVQTPTGLFRRWRKPDKTLNYPIQLLFSRNPSGDVYHKMNVEF